MTMLKYTFLGAAVMAVVVNTIYGFDAPILKMSLFSTPMLVLLFVLVFPTTISYLLLPLGLKYLKTTLVAIYGYLILIVATVTSFVLGRLATYASRCIENEILMYFRAQRKTSGEVHLGDAIEMDKDGNPLTLQDVIRDERDMEQELEQKIRWEKVRRYIEAMPEGREREILVLRYGLDNQKPLTQREVAQRLNISRSYVSRIEKSVLAAIRRAVQPEENGKKQRNRSTIK